MLISSGVTFGLRRTIPHMLGITLGLAMLLASVALGLIVIIENYPILFLFVKIAGGIYMLYLALRITQSREFSSSPSSSSRPMHFFEAVLFQFVNVKAWVQALVAISAYASEGSYLWNIVLIIFVSLFVNSSCCVFWASFGVMLRRFLTDPIKLKIFNWFMALSLVISLWPILATEL